MPTYAVKPFPKRVLKGTVINYWTLDHIINVADMLGGPVPDYKFPKFNSKYCFTPKIKFSPLQPEEIENEHRLPGEPKYLPNPHQNEPTRGNLFHEIMFNTVAFARGKEYIIFYPTAALKAGLMLKDEDWIKNNIFYNSPDLFEKVKAGVLKKGDKRLFCEANRKGKYCDNAGNFEISSKSQEIVKPLIKPGSATGKNFIQRFGLNIKKKIKRGQAINIIKQYTGDALELPLDDELYLDELLEKANKHLTDEELKRLTADLEQKLNSNAYSLEMHFIPLDYSVDIKQPMKYFNHRTRIPDTHQLICGCPIGMLSHVKYEYKTMTVNCHHSQLVTNLLYSGDICIAISIGDTKVDSLPGLSRVFGPLIDLTDPFVQDLARVMTAQIYLRNEDYPGNLGIAESEEFKVCEVDSYALQFFDRIMDPELVSDIKSTLVTDDEMKKFTAREFGLFKVEDKFMNALKILHSNEIQNKTALEAEAYLYNRLRDPSFTRGDPSVFSVDVGSVTNPLLIAAPDDFKVIIGWPYKDTKIKEPFMGQQYKPKIKQPSS